jgi:hypothetical protein
MIVTKTKSYVIPPPFKLLVCLTDRVVLVPPSPPHSDVQEDEYDWPDIAPFYFYESPAPVALLRVVLHPAPSLMGLTTSPRTNFRSLSHSRPKPSPRAEPSPMTPAVLSNIHSMPSRWWSTTRYERASFSLSFTRWAPRIWSNEKEELRAQHDGIQRIRREHAADFRKDHQSEGLRTPLLS